MTIEKLEMYYGIASNVEAMEKELETLYVPVSSPNGHEGTGGCTPSNPTERSALRIIAIREQINEEIDRMRELQEEIETWLTSISDKEIAAIVRWKYMHRLDWSRTNMKVYGYPSYDYSRKKLRRYFERLSEKGE